MTTLQSQGVAASITIPVLLQSRLLTRPGGRGLTLNQIRYAVD
jgi:hypothetical protein